MRFGWESSPIRASYVRKQKTDRWDAKHILQLLLEGRFPKIWVPTTEIRDHRKLLIHRHKLVQIRTRVKNELQHLMLNQGMQKKQKLWSTEGRAALQSLPLKPSADQRRRDLLNLLTMLDGQLGQLDERVAQVAILYPQVGLLMSQPGVGAVTALAFLLTIEDVCRFRRAKHLASYLGLIPREYSSGGKQRMGGISKQGNPLLRFLLVEAANIAVRFDPVLRKEYLHRCHQKHPMVAKVAAARKLAIRLYWILRTQTPYPQVLSSRVAFALSANFKPLAVRRRTIHYRQLTPERSSRIIELAGH
jgi:transposase